jgi:hypothetical protein
LIDERDFPSALAAARVGAEWAWMGNGNGHK